MVPNSSPRSWHRTVKVGRDLWSSSGPTPLLNQGHLELVAQDHVQTLLNVSKDGDPTTSALALPVLDRGEGPLQPADHTLNTAQETVVLRSESTLGAPGQLGVHQDPSSKAGCLQHLLVHGVVPPQVEEEERLQNISP